VTFLWRHKRIIKKPNFFIIGLSKSGTTALSEYLRGHPNVFFSNPKELGFFLPGTHANCHRIDNVNQYLYYFRGATEQHLAIGEGTPDYFRDVSTIKNILEFNPDSKFILMIRNPVERFFSLHAHLYFYGIEIEANPMLAWEKSRRANQNKKKCLNYLNMCLVSESIKNLLALVQKKKLLIILYNELSENSDYVYENVLKFLELPMDGRSDFPKINKTYLTIRPKFNKIFCFGSQVYYYLRKNFRIKNKYFFSMIKKIKKCFESQATVDFNIKPSDAFISKLTRYFEDDIRNLARILNDERVLKWLD